MITLHHLNNSRSQRILWFLEELGLDYEIKYYQRDPETMLAPSTIKAIHPLGKAPIITDDDLILAESGAIIDYLARNYGDENWIPKAGTQEALAYQYWLNYAEGSLMPPLLLKFVFDRVESNVPFFIKPIAKGISTKVKQRFINPQIALHRDFVEAELAKTPWFAGEHISGADVQMSYPLEILSQRNELGSDYPNIKSWLQAIHQRPAYHRALQKGEYSKI